MTEEEARSYVAALAVSRETLQRLDIFVRILVEANASQNLIAASTLPTVWVRHIADSAQLLPLASNEDGLWADLGSGPGFPGLVVAAMSERPVLLIEERAKRAAFLRDVAEAMCLAKIVRVEQRRVERVSNVKATTISARAFAPLSRLFELAHPLCLPDTLWLLPKGRSASRELEEVRDTWQGEFRAVPSITDPEAAIIVATHVHPKDR